MKRTQITVTCDEPNCGQFVETGTTKSELAEAIAVTMHGWECGLGDTYCPSHSRFTCGTCRTTFRGLMAFDRHRKRKTCQR
ncbi:hypothetical protein [Actinopolyspora halophila]|uniref:hypothetical protein n=1 Tax=Actinopolyspora halophila TaxID=1850 RepID=UPI000366F8E5|nr:hypothetical protein [Actinopolyspora halophila]